jgi:histidine decarboxylase
MKQITIVAADHPGLAADIAETLSTAGVNIDTLTAEAIGGTMVAILTVDKYDEALRALAARRFQAITEDALVIRIDDKPGELARITHRFKDANINIRSIRFVRREGGKAMVAIATERTDEAMELVRDTLVS